MITFSEAAVKQINKILTHADNIGMHMRIYVEGGGCSGMQYGFTLDNQQEDDDFVVAIGNNKALVDAASMQYLIDAIIDYKETLTESRFVIDNPNSKGQCGCGSSFAV